MQVLGPGAFQEVDLRAAFAPAPPGARRCCREPPRRAGGAGVQARAAAPGRRASRLPRRGADAAGARRAGRAPTGRVARRRSRRPPSARSAARPARRRDAPGLHRRPRRAQRHEPIVALAERLGAPIVTTFKAKGVVPDDHPWPPASSAAAARRSPSWLMNEADLLVVLGASFANHTGIYQGHPIIQVDLDPLQLGKFHPVTVPVWAHVGVAAPGAGRRARRHGGDRPARRRRVPPRPVGAPRRPAASPTTAGAASTARRSSPPSPASRRRTR